MYKKSIIKKNVKFRCKDLNIEEASDLKETRSYYDYWNFNGFCGGKENKSCVKISLF